MRSEKLLTREYQFYLPDLDNSVLVEAFTGHRRAMPDLAQAVSASDVLTCSTLVLFEWLRGPRQEIELSTFWRFFDASSLRPFGAAEAATSAALYRDLARARQRQADLAIAACAMEDDATLWTLNAADFEDIPGLKLYSVRRR